MAKQELDGNIDRIVNFIVGLKKQNFSEKEIKEGLYKKGWTEQQVRTIFNIVHSRTHRGVRRRIKKIKISKKISFKKHKLQKKLKIKKHKLKISKKRHKVKAKPIEKKPRLSYRELIRGAPYPRRVKVRVKRLKLKPNKIKIKKYRTKISTRQIRLGDVEKHKAISVRKVKPYFKQKKPQKTTPQKTSVIHVGSVITDFDRLVDLVNQKEVVKLSDVAKKFNINQKQAEEWGKILDARNLLHLHYPAFGGPELRKWKK